MDIVGDHFWLALAGIAIAVAVGAAVVMWVVGAAWYAWGGLGAFVAFAVVALVVMAVQDRRHPERREL
jgi:hypothetical protein